MTDQLYVVFDVESIGIHGEAFAVGYVVIDAFCGRELESDYWHCDPSCAQGVLEDRKWVNENILSTVSFNKPSLADPYQVQNAFWEKWLEWKARGAELVADCQWPVEARFLAACVDLDPVNRKWQGPYPLHEVATALLLAGRNPHEEYARLPSELPKHHPVCDARQSARLFIEAKRKVGAIALYEEASA